MYKILYIFYYSLGLYALNNEAKESNMKNRKLPSQDKAKYNSENQEVPENIEDIRIEDIFSGIKKNLYEIKKNVQILEKALPQMNEDQQKGEESTDQK